MSPLSATRSAKTNELTDAAPGRDQLWMVAAQRSEDGTFGLDRHGCIFAWTLGAARIFGYPEDQAMGMMGELLFAEDERPQYNDHSARALGGETIERLPFTARRSDGMVVPVSATFVPLDMGGGICVIVRDLTERSISQQTLEDGQAQMAEAQELSHFGIWLWHAPSGMVQMSEELYRIHGLDPLNFDGRMQSRIALAHPDDRRQLVRKLRGALASRSTFEMEYRFVRAGGEVRWVYERANVVRDQGGQVAGLRGICQDVTERREAANFLKRQTVLLDMLRHITVAANESSDLREALQSCVAQICSTFNWSVGHALLLGPGQIIDDHVWHMAEPGHFGRYQSAVAARPQPGATGIAEMVLQSREPVWVADIPLRRKCDELKIARAVGLRSGFGFPVAVDQELAAVVELLSPERREVDAEFIEAAMEGAAQLGRVVERIRTRDHNAMHDPLTNLPNRNLFMNYVRQAIRRLRPGSGLVAVMFIDLDNFKQINDNLGHEVGDRVLTTIADRFAGTVRRGDIVGRFGGDEFLVLCEQVPLVEPLVEIAARLVKVVAEPVFLDGGSAIVVSGSVGVAVATSPEMTAEDLVRDADAAMYRAKQEGPGRMQISATGETTVAAGRTSDAN